MVGLQQKCSNLSNQQNMEIEGTKWQCGLEPEVGLQPSQATDNWLVVSRVFFTLNDPVIL